MNTTIDIARGEIEAPTGYSVSAGRFCSQPTLSEPMMLNRPIAAITQPPVCAVDAAIDQIGRQMHGDEGELKAAGEEAEHQQHIGAVAEGLRQRRA